MLSHCRTLPILRSFDEAKARAFYVDFLGFAVDWECRPEPGAPLYMQVSREGIALHVSERDQDGAAGVCVRVEVFGLRALHAELAAKRHRFGERCLERLEWSGTEMTVVDPADNRLIFAEADDPDD
jgi:catechol 2,3-dioxygenase-like lactoylglutathione lyase family enzyme